MLLSLLSDTRREITHKGSDAEFDDEGLLVFCVHLSTPQVLWTRVTNRHTHGQAKLIRVQQREGLIGSCAADKKQLVLCCKVRLQHMHCSCASRPTKRFAIRAALRCGALRGRVDTHTHLVLCVASVLR